jgi:diacylglycerol kinase family enzyme
MTGFLIVNPSSGNGGATELLAAAKDRGITTHVLRTGEDLTELARNADADAIGMAGGDGSLAPVASVALERGLPFVCIPFGTRNHFARDVGLDRNDPLAALEAFCDDAAELRIDAARVGDRLFLNNLSFGIYARLVHRREHRRRRGEALARLKALVAVTRHHHALHARVNDEPVRARVIFVGNNCYELSLFTVGERERLDTGELFLWTAEGWLPTAWEQRTGSRFEIETGADRIRAAVDGEPIVLASPVTVESLPGAIRLRLPAERGAAMHDNPEATEREQELAQTERQNEEESQRYPSGLEAPPAKPPAPGPEDGSPSATRGGQPDTPGDASE